MEQVRLKLRINSKGETEIDAETEHFEPVLTVNSRDISTADLLVKYNKLTEFIFRLEKRLTLF